MDYEQECIGIVRKEVQAYDNPEVFITDKISFRVKPLIKQLRKNYRGVFDNPIDKITGKKKIWVPLTASMVDNTRKNVDLDPKDINFFSTKQGGYGITQILRAFTRDYFNKTYYGEDMDDVAFSMCVDPVAIMKIVPVKRNNKTHIDRFDVDPLNIYVDPTVENIQSAYRFTEKALLTKDVMRGMKGWINIDKVQEQEMLPKYDQYSAIYSGATTKSVDVYELWGKIPKYLITGNEKDTEDVDGHIVVSGLFTNPLLHYVGYNTNRDADDNIIKPYEDTRYMKIPGSFYGVSPAMAVLDIQEWINTIVNLRINKNTVAQLGLFKVRTGSNINTQSLTKLISNGVIKVTNMDDLDNFQIPEAGPGSYRDEETAKNWAMEATSAFDIVRGTLPSSATATGAVIQDRNAKSSFVIVRDSLARFNEKVITRHFLPHLPEMIKQEGVVKYLADMNEITELRKMVVNELALEQLEKMEEIPTEQELLDSMAQAERKLAQQKDLWIDVVGDIAVDGIKSEIRITNEKLDVGSTARNLQELIQILPPEARNDTAATLFDVLGLPVPLSLRSGQVQTQTTTPNLSLPDQLGQFTQSNLPIEQYGQQQ